VRPSARPSPEQRGSAEPPRPDAAPPLPTLTDAAGTSHGPTAGAGGDTLDPPAAATCHRLAGVLFPWDITRALELALLRTFCVPSIAGLLDRTGEFEKRPRKRYDDTGLMVAELLRHGPDSSAGRAVISRMNRIHGHYAISNDDFLYVLSTFVAEPIRWLQRYGWRALTADEQQALFRFWRRVGQRMNIDRLPSSLEALLAFNQAFETERFALTPANARVAEATLAMLLQDWPPALQPTLRRLLMALPETAVSGSLGWPATPSRLQAAIRAGLRLRSRLANAWSRLVPPDGTRFYSERPTPSYGAQFQLEQLGPPPLLKNLNRPRWQGTQRRIGLTGGIASGKSSVGRLLAEQGLPLLDADVFAREALAPGSPGARAVLERYGKVVRQAGSDPDAAVIDRAALGRIVFADEAERRWLEELVHPLVRERFAAELAALQEAPAVVLVIPLLFEAGLEGRCSEVWLVDCDPEQQLQRLMARDGLSDADARARLEAQWPLQRKRPLADRLIDNRAEPDALKRQVLDALGKPG
jgi:dephospho-CoA kinase